MERFNLWNALVTLGIAIAIPWALSRWLPRAMFQRTAKLFRRLSLEFGGTVTPPTDTTTEEPVWRFRYQNREYEVGFRFEQAGNHFDGYFYATCLAPAGLQARISGAGLATRLGLPLSNGVRIGVPEFDRRFHVDTEADQPITTWLRDPGVREAISSLMGSGLLTRMKNNAELAIGEHGVSVSKFYDSKVMEPRNFRVWLSKLDYLAQTVTRLSHG